MRPGPDPCVKSMPPAVSEIDRALTVLHGESGGPPSDLFAYCLREICSFQTTEQRAAAALRALLEIGTEAAALGRARPARLKSALDKAGPFASDRLLSLQRLLRLVQVELHGDFDSLFKRSRVETKRLLKAVFGDHGSDRLMMLSGRHAILALDAHGVRVALRLGFGESKKNYGTTYTSVQRELAPLIGEDPRRHWRIRELLRAHGRRICRLEDPRCDNCPLTEGCAFNARSRAG